MASTTEDKSALEQAVLRTVVNKVPVMLAYWDRDQRCRFANRAYEKWFGVPPEAVIGMSMKELLGPLHALNLPYIENALRGEPQEFEREIPDPAGGPARYSQAHYIPDVVDGVVRGFCVVVADITRRKRAEESLQALQQQLGVQERFAAMATLAAGIAHEINNPLAAVLGNIEIALTDLEEGELDSGALREALHEARSGATRVRDIVRNMKLLVGGTAAQPERINVADSIEQSLALAANTLRYRARIVRELAPDLFVDANASQLAQVFVNLLSNAAQAMPEDSPQQNTIRVTSRRQNDQVVVEVADNGHGIPEAIQSRIFEPYFSTKDVGEGMGLGLSIARSIVEQLGGKLSVASQVGQGSVFRVTLPPSARTEAVAETKPLAQAPVIPPDIPSNVVASRARPHLLIIDDEPSVGAVLKRILSQDDYDITVAHSGSEALALLRGPAAQRFDLIVCDLMMPEMSGDNLYRAATSSRPALASRFVFMTGGAFTPRGRQFLARVAAPILEKPFTSVDVRRLVSARLRLLWGQLAENESLSSRTVASGLGRG